MVSFGMSNHCVLCGESPEVLVIVNGLAFCDELCIEAHDELLRADAEVPDDVAEEMAAEYEAECEYDSMSDAEADADTLRMAGMGTDEDYDHGDAFDDGFSGTNYE